MRDATESTEVPVRYLVVSTVPYSVLSRQRKQGFITRDKLTTPLTTTGNSLLHWSRSLFRRHCRYYLLYHQR